MSVVNVKVQYIRQNGYNDLSQWMKDENNVYIGRAGIVFINKERFPKQSSIFCNIFKVGKDGTRDEVINKYEDYIRRKIIEDPNIKNELLKLKGKTLGCWCKPESCHGDVLLKLINEITLTF
jgi:hypothetical protein